MNGKNSNVDLTVPLERVFALSPPGIGKLPAKSQHEHEQERQPPAPGPLAPSPALAQPPRPPRRGARKQGSRARGSRGQRSGSRSRSRRDSRAYSSCHNGSVLRSTGAYLAWCSVVCGWYLRASSCAPLRAPASSTPATRRANATSSSARAVRWRREATRARSPASPRQDSASMPHVVAWPLFRVRHPSLSCSHSTQLFPRCPSPLATPRSRYPRSLSLAPNLAFAAVAWLSRPRLLSLSRSLDRSRK